MSTNRYIPLGDDVCLRSAWARSGSLAFSNDPDTIKEYLNRLDREKWCRVLVDENDELIATLMSTRIGMFICGSRVSAEAVGFVSIPPEHRGKRASVELMHHHLREAHENGSALSLLYSSRARTYRRVGYEIAGRRSLIEIPLRSLRSRLYEGADTVSVRAMEDADLAAIRAFYCEQAQAINGNLDRDDWFWGYTLGTYQKRMRPVFVFEREGVITGYMVITNDADREGHKMGSTLEIHDLMLADAPTARAMIRFLSGFSSTRGIAMLPGDLSHPLLDHIDELWYKVERSYLWFVRVLSLEKAIAERGFNPCLRGEVMIEIEDDLFEHNRGVWKFVVENGKGRAERADSDAQIHMSIDAVGPVFTGFTSASQLAKNDRIQGSREAIETLDGLFAAPTPWMPDDF